MYKKKIIVLISLILIISFSIAGCSGNGDSNLAFNKDVNITVIDDDTQDPLSNVILTIQTEEGEITGTTNSNGVYSFEAKFIESDSYNVTVSKEGYEKKTVALNITVNSDNISLNISLKNDLSVVVVSNS